MDARAIDPEWQEAAGEGQGPRRPKGVKGRPRGRWREHCGWCGGLHTEGECRAAPALVDESIKVEHRGGNGPYTGPARVRVLPPGVGRLDLVAAGEASMTALEVGRIRGRASRWATKRGTFAREQEPMKVARCARCGETGHFAISCFRSLNQTSIAGR